MGGHICILRRQRLQQLLLVLQKLGQNSQRWYVPYEKPKLRVICRNVHQSSLAVLQTFCNLPLYNLWRDALTGRTLHK